LVVPSEREGMDVKTLFIFDLILKGGGTVSTHLTQAKTDSLGFSLIRSGCSDGERVGRGLFSPVKAHRNA